MPFPNPDTQFKQGHGPNGAGRPKGTRSLSAVIQQMMEDDNFETEIQKGVVLKGRPSSKIAKVMYDLSLQGNIKAADWLAKYGYGTKLDVTSDGESLNKLKTLSDEELNNKIEDYIARRRSS